ncbi:DinB family protein [Pararhizobium sp.]|uniref:DinB family protein n=1 Tax=Pararhizobium sp. TaxID=1977563 RepID=UPI002729157A|nr:DinB family protein [Pararhizobium sp.]MDO9415116.1 DinB family protein [Pararhizobium sp.]
MDELYDPARVFRKLAISNRLANSRLHRACATLQDGEFRAVRIGFFPSISLTLNHIFQVDLFYVDALEGGKLGYRAFEIEEPFRDIGLLAEAQAQVDQRLLTLCSGLDAARLSSTVEIHRGNRVQTDRMDDVVSHLFQHQTHHRGQAHAMLSGTSVAPPQLDEFIVGDDAGVRADDLLAAGLSEADLML